MYGKKSISGTGRFTYNINIHVPCMVTVQTNAPICTIGKKIQKLNETRNKIMNNIKYIFNSYVVIHGTDYEPLEAFFC